MRSKQRCLHGTGETPHCRRRKLTTCSPPQGAPGASPPTQRSRFTRWRSSRRCGRPPLTLCVPTLSQRGSGEYDTPLTLALCVCVPSAAGGTRQVGGVCQVCAAGSFEGSRPVMSRLRRSQTKTNQRQITSYPTPCPQLQRAGLLQAPAQYRKGDAAEEALRRPGGVHVWGRHGGSVHGEHADSLVHRVRPVMMMSGRTS